MNRIESGISSHEGKSHFFETVKHLLIAGVGILVFIHFFDLAIEDMSS